MSFVESSIPGVWRRHVPCRAVDLPGKEEPSALLGLRMNRANTWCQSADGYTHGGACMP